MSVERDVVVIGAGHNGLTAAFYLARAGLDVEIIEALDTLGGACKTEELIPGYRFSTCANYVLWLRSRVVEDLRLFDRGVQIGGGDVWTRVLPGNEPFVFWPDQDRQREEIARFSRRDSKAWPAWQALWDDAARLIGPYLLSYPPSLPQLLARADELDMSRTFEMLLTSSLAKIVDHYFESDVMRNGFNVPHDLGSMYDHGGGFATALAAAVERYSETGAAMPRGFVKGGLGVVARAVAEACREEGVAVRASAPVRRILVERGAAIGVELASGEEIRARVILSSTDPKRTFLSLVGHEHLNSGFAQRIESLRTDIAPLKFHCALSERPEYYAFPDSDLPTRGLFIINPTREYHERAWDDARHRRLPEAPFMALMTPSAWDESVAPLGHHTVSIWTLFAPVRLAQGTWPERREEMAERLLGQIQRYSPNFRDALVDHFLLTPWDLEQRVLLTDGNIHHIDIEPSQMLWQRPLPELSRYRAPIAGLYLCGASQHPYGEISFGPGHNAAHAVLEDLGELEPGSWEQIARMPTQGRQPSATPSPLSTS